jgi:hypothetical protein
MLETFELLTVGPRIGLPWPSVTVVILKPVFENMNMPLLYSIEIGELLVKIFEELNPCTLLFDPEIWKGNVQKIGATLVTGNLPEDLLVRDCQVLHCIAQLLAVNWKRLSYGNYNKFQGEVFIECGETAAILCHTCDETVSHADSASACVNKFMNNPITYGQIDQSFYTQEFNKIEGFWVCQLKTAMGHMPVLSERILQLSSECAHAAGFTVTEPNALPRPAAATYIDHVEKVISALPKNTHVPIFVQTTMDSETHQTDETMRKIAMSFVSEVDRLRSKYGVSIVILGPVPRYYENMTDKDYVIEKARVIKMSQILTVYALKCYVPIVPLHGIMYSIPGPPGQGWSHVRGQRPERLFTYTGLPSREFSKRLGCIIRSIVRIYGAVNKLEPYKKHYTDNIFQKFHFHHSYRK